MTRLIAPKAKKDPIVVKDYKPIGHLVPETLVLNHFCEEESRYFSTLTYLVDKKKISGMSTVFSYTFDWVDRVSLPTIGYTPSFCGGVWIGDIRFLLRSGRHQSTLTLRDRLLLLCGFMLLQRASCNKGFVFGAVPVDHWDFVHESPMQRLSKNSNVVRKERHKSFSVGEALTRLGFSITGTAINPNSRNLCRSLLAIVSDEKFKNPKYWTELVDTYLAELNYEFYEGPVADAPF